ncbi:hypothetical protein [Aliiroseovarius sp. S253]|uniref:hypothetical protein n=1 Tax=Aliiroseovarius sp. S253 TaxID=3415133 RepID=UPI003C7BD97F
MKTSQPLRAKRISYGTQFLLLSVVALAVYGFLFLLLNNDLLGTIGLEADTSGFEWADKILGVTVALAGAWVTLAIAQRTLRNSEEMEILQLRGHVKEDIQAFHDFFESLNKLYAKAEDIAAKAMQAYLDGLDGQKTETALNRPDQDALQPLRLSMSSNDFAELKRLRDELLALNRTLEIHSTDGRGPLALAFAGSSLSREILTHNDWVENAKLVSKKKNSDQGFPNFDPDAITTEIAYEEFKAKRLVEDDLNLVLEDLAPIFRREWLVLMREIIGHEVLEMEKDKERIHAAMIQNRDAEFAKDTAQELEDSEKEYEALVELRLRLIDLAKDNDDLGLTEEQKELLLTCPDYSSRASHQEQFDAVEKEVNKMLWRIQQLEDELEHHSINSDDHLQSLRGELVLGLTGYYADDPNQERGSYRKYVARQMKRKKSRLLSAVQQRDVEDRDFFRKSISMILGEVLFPHHLPKPGDQERRETNLNLGMAYLHDLLAALPEDFASMMSSIAELGKDSRMHDVLMADILNRPLPIQVSLHRLVETADMDPDFFVQQYGDGFEQALADSFDETFAAEAVSGAMEFARRDLLEELQEELAERKKKLKEKNVKNASRVQSIEPPRDGNDQGDQIPF